jgi:hypothetical protein
LTVRHHTAGPSLHAIDLTSGEVTEIGSFGLPDLEAMRALAFLPSGELASISVTGALVRVDPATGQATLVGNLGTTFYPYNLELAADACGRLWMVAGAGGAIPHELWRIDPTTGTGESLGELAEPVTGLAAYGETLYGLVVNPTCEGADLVRIDPESLSVTHVATLTAWTCTGIDSHHVDFDAEGELLDLGGIPPPPLVAQLIQRFDLAGNHGPTLGPVVFFGVGLAASPSRGSCSTAEPLAVPTVSTLGAAGLTLLLAATGILVLLRRRTAMG